MAKKGSERTPKNGGKLRVAVIGCGETAYYGAVGRSASRAGCLL